MGERTESTRFSDTVSAAQDMTWARSSLFTSRDTTMDTFLRAASRSSLLRSSTMGAVWVSSALMAKSVLNTIAQAAAQASIPSHHRTKARRMVRPSTKAMMGIRITRTPSALSLRVRRGSSLLTMLSSAPISFPIHTTGWTRLGGSPSARSMTSATRGMMIAYSQRSTRLPS